MDTTNALSTEILAERLARLEAAASALKREFSGIDRAIDRVVDAIRSWYLMPELQARPLVVNLWGLTGTGKTSMVLRLIELLDLGDRTFRFDLGLENFGYHLSSELEKRGQHAADTPTVFVFDEIQNARTIDETGKESGPRDAKLVWELLDTGTFIAGSTWHSRSRSTSVLALRSFVDVALAEGITFAEGRVADEPERYAQIMGRSEASLDILTDVEMAPIGETLELPLYRIRQRLERAGTKELVALLDEARALALSQRHYDFRSALVFMIGNLDEAFAMSGELNPDSDPDQFRDATLRIGAPEIKKALRKRFRAEQIARLGSIHVAYPALGSADYARVIRSRLERVSADAEELSGLRVEFDASIDALVLAEGVYPTQGVRSVLSTIDELVKAGLGAFLAGALAARERGVDAARISYADGTMYAELVAGTRCVGMLERPCPIELGRRRKSARDDRQAIVAAHEAGHAALAVILLGRMPRLAVSRSADDATQGFVGGRLFDRIVVKDELVPRLAVLLGGRVAERLVFGAEAVTDGASSDLSEATRFALESAKSDGFGPALESHREPAGSQNHYFHDRDGSMEELASAWLREAEALAEATLRRHEVLFDAFAGRLFEDGRIDRAAIETIVARHLPGFRERTAIFDGSVGRHADALRARLAARSSVAVPAAGSEVGADVAAYGRNG